MPDDRFQVDGPPSRFDRMLTMVRTWCVVAGLLTASASALAQAPAPGPDSDPTAVAEEGAPPTAARETGEAASPVPLKRKGLQALDAIAIGGYGVAMLAIGWLSSRKTKTTEDYLLGGRKMNPSAVGLSLFATLISTISYLAVPGEVIKYGPVYLAQVAALPIIYLIAGYLLIPYIMRLPVTSAYEILEGRLGIQVRLLGSLIFLLTRLVWMGLIIFTSSKAMVVMLGMEKDQALYVGVVMSLVTVVYTSLGGFRASVITGAIQTFILLGGALICIAYVTWRMGGVGSWWPSEWAPNWSAQPFFSPSPYTRATVVGMLVTTIAWWVCTAGSDQMTIQRYLSTRDAKAARHAFLVSNVAEALTTFALALVGFSLLAFFRDGAAHLPAGYSVSGNADDIFPYFITNVLPAGMGGLVIAGLLAAAMSSLSAGFSSCCSVVTVDFLDRFKRTEVTGRRHLQRTQIISIVVGLVVTGLSLAMTYIRGNILEMTSKTTNLFVAPLFVLFFMAMFVPFATPFGTFFGAFYGLAAGALVGYWDQLTGHDPLSWQLIVPASMSASIAAGCLFSLVPTRGKGWATIVLFSLVALAPILAVFAWVRPT